MNMRQFWQLSFYCAVTTKQLAVECGMMDSERFFVAGLLHDLGHLFMYIAIPRESQLIKQKADQLNQPRYIVERETLGFDHAALGAHMMAQWGLPRSLWKMTCHHPEPDKADEFGREASLLHLGALLAGSDLEQGDFGEGAHRVDPACLQATGLTMKQCLRLRQVSAGEYEEVLNSLFPGGG